MCLQRHTGVFHSRRVTTTLCSLSLTHTEWDRVVLIGIQTFKCTVQATGAHIARYVVCVLSLCEVSQGVDIIRNRKCYKITAVLTVRLVPAPSTWRQDSLLKLSVE